MLKKILLTVIVSAAITGYVKSESKFYKTPDAAERKIEKKFEVAPGQQLVIDLKMGGDIIVKGWNQESIKVDIELKGDDADDIDVEFDHTSSGLEIVADYDGSGWSYDADGYFKIMVPEKFNVEFQTAGGDVDLIGIEGSLEGKTMGGDLELNNLNGELILTTMGGNIDLKDSDVDGNVKTMGGDVLVENVIGDVSAKSMGGDIIHKNVKRRSGESIGEEVSITTMGGDLMIDEAANGAKLKTMGGDVEANYVAKFLDVKTMGGDIDVKAIDGWIKATTMGGDINVKMVGDPDEGDRSITLTSMGGEIIIYVPESLSMSLDIELAYTKKYEGDVNITSDFEFNEERTKEWEDKDGSPRKYIYGTGEINGGKNKVTIKTINGNIKLLKN